MSEGISIGGISVGLGDTRNIAPPSIQGSSGASSDLVSALAAAAGISGASSLSFGGSSINEAMGLDGASVKPSISAEGASFRFQPTSFMEKEQELNQIAQYADGLNSPGIGMSYHSPTPSEPSQSASSIYGGLIS